MAVWLTFLEDTLARSRSCIPIARQGPRTQQQAAVFNDELNQHHHPIGDSSRSNWPPHDDNFDPTHPDYIHQATAGPRPPP
jgi:hypothetical protein